MVKKMWINLGFCVSYLHVWLRIVLCVSGSRQSIVTFQSPPTINVLPRDSKMWLYWSFFILWLGGQDTAKMRIGFRRGWRCALDMVRLIPVQCVVTDAILDDDCGTSVSCSVLLIGGIYSVMCYTKITFLCKARFGYERLWTLVVWIKGFISSEW